MEEKTSWVKVRAEEERLHITREEIDRKHDLSHNLNRK